MLLEKEFQEYLEKMYSNKIGPNQLVHIRKAFHAGSLCTAILMASNIEKAPDILKGIMADVLLVTIQDALKQTKSDQQEKSITE